MNSNYLVFSSCLADYWTGQCRWSHNFYSEPMLSWLQRHVLTSIELEADERGSPAVQATPEGIPGEFTVTDGKYWQTASPPPPKGKRISTLQQQQNHYRLGYPNYLKCDFSRQALLEVTQDYSAIRTNYQANPFTLTPRNNDSRDISSCSLACQGTLLITSLQNKHQLLEPDVQATACTSSTRYR